MFTTKEKAKINEYYKIALERIKTKHIACFEGHEKPVFLISDCYPGVWLEHVYDSVFFAKLDDKYIDIAKNTLMLFLNNQNENGQFPCYVIDRKKCTDLPEYGYSQTQECVSFASLCYEYYEMSEDREFLKLAYDKCIKWVNWYKKYRMPSKKGLVEMFCGYDTGHDNSGRLEDVMYDRCAKDENAEEYPAGDNVLPAITPDMNAVFYGNLSALSKMAEALGDLDAVRKWNEDAQFVKKQMFDICYDSDDEFFYDVDKNGNMRKYLSISVTNIFTEHMLDLDEMDIIYEKHLKNPNEFYMPYPFPSMAKSDKTFKKTLSGNSWGYYSQALTMLRCTRWMDFYGKSSDFDEILEKWIKKWTFDNKIMFGQELDPITGENSDCSQWYSSGMLIYIYAVKRLGLLEN